MFSGVMALLISTVVLHSCGRPFNDCAKSSNSGYCDGNFNLSAAEDGIQYELATPQLLDGRTRHVFSGICNINQLNFIFESDLMEPSKIQVRCQEGTFEAEESVIFLVSENSSVPVSLVVTNGPLLEKNNLTFDIDFDFPTLSLTHPFILLAGASDVIEGGCSDEVGQVELTGPFQESPLMVSCSGDKIFTSEPVLFDQTAGIYTIKAVHTDRLERSVVVETQLTLQ